MAGTHRRRNYFIKKPFQTKFIVGFILLLIFQVLLIGGLLMRSSNQTITTGYSGSRFVMEKTSSFFFINFIIVGLSTGITIGIAGFLTFIMLSHRIAGPLHRFENVLNGLSEGNLLNRTNLRRTDQLAELQRALDKALKNIDDQLKRIKKDVEAAQKMLAEKDSQGRLPEIKEALAGIKDKIDFFKTS
ncbi:MAG: methyl-accepting chemotaxis protein [Candidatus Omnitrophota bacterium]